MTRMLNDMTSRPEWQCLYKGSVCTRVRTIKDDGEYHRFCETHRAIAIRNQQRWLQRRRAKKQETSGRKPCPSPISDLSMDPGEPLCDAEWFMLAAQLLDVPAAPVTPPVATARATMSPKSLKTQRHKRRAEQTSRLMMPYLHI